MTVLTFLKLEKVTYNDLSYRSITLSSCLCKMMERMVNQRMVFYLEKERFFHRGQYGFRKGRCSLDAVAIIDTYIKMTFARKEYVAAVLFDVEEAYDTTWRNAILQTLRDVYLAGHLHLPRSIKNFLSSRLMRVRVGNTLSDPYTQCEGVPQEKGNA